MGIRYRAVLACGLSVASVLINAQTVPEVTFKIEVNSVEEDVRVLDQQGNLVRGLTRDDFQVSENGKPQKIATFGVVDLPFAPVEKPVGSILPIEPDVVSNQRGQDGRLYLIVLDDYHVDPARTPQVRRLIRQFIVDKLDANDQAAIVVTSGRADASQDFTQSRLRLLDAADQFSGQKLPSVTSTLLDIGTRDTSTGAQPNNVDSGVVAGRRTPNTFLSDADIAERVQRARLSLGTLASLSDWMSRVRGRRKALIYVTEGIDYTNYGAFAGPDSATRNFEQVKDIEDQLQEAIHAATRGNVQIYPVDPRGLAPMTSDFQIEDARASIAVREAFGAERAVSQERLRELAEKTGGVVATGTNDVQQAFDRIVQESSSYYVLGYYSSNEKPDGKVRTVDVKVKGYPDSQVSFRKQYTAALPIKTSTPPSGVVGLLTDAMRSPLPMAGLPFRLTAIPHGGQGKNVSLELLIEFAKGDLRFQTNGDTRDNTIYVSIAAFTKAGKSVAEDRRAIALKLKPDTYQRVNQFGVRVLRQIEVAPGSYSVHVAVRDAVDQKQGSLRIDVDAPDFAAVPLAMSGLVLTAANSTVAYAVGADLFTAGLPAAPTAQREFTSGDTLATLVEVYDNNRTTPHMVDLRATVKTADGRTVFDKHDETAIDGGSANQGIGYRTAVPLQGWAAGSYVLTVEATSRLGNTPPVSRSVLFSVR